MVKIKKAEKTTASGIVIPDTANEEKSQEGIVEAVGGSEKIMPEIKKGVKVLFKKYSGTDVEIGKEDYVLLDGSEKHGDILAVVE